jgi:hypothetical protein
VAGQPAPHGIQQGHAAPAAGRAAQPVAALTRVQDRAATASLSVCERTFVQRE